MTGSWPGVPFMLSVAPSPPLSKDSGPKSLSEMPLGNRRGPAPEELLRQGEALTFPQVAPVISGCGWARLGRTR